MTLVLANRNKETFRFISKISLLRAIELSLLRRLSVIEFDPNIRVSTQKALNSRYSSE